METHISAANAAALSGSTLITSVLATILALTFLWRFALMVLRRPRLPARRQAAQRAEILLRQVIGDDLLSRIMSDGFLDIHSHNSDSPDRVYRIMYPQDGVLVLEKGVAVEYLCVVPRTWVPDADIFLMHKSMLEADEDHYVRVAQHFPLFEQNTQSHTSSASAGTIGDRLSEAS